MPNDEIEKAVLADERTQRWMEGKSVRKFIIVSKRIVNVVIG
jgi:leucyl-tRNA synthetase